jgi:G3E family GTPase
MAKKVPVHILTGFLGSGKTTLLNEILKNPEFSNSAVIINEFGEMGLDHHLVEATDDNIIELANGCLCCTVRGQLIETIEALLGRKPQRILIETTGLADPVPVISAVMAGPSIQDQIEFRGLITVFDCLQSADWVKRYREASRQLELADWTVVSKLDQVDEADQAKIYKQATDFIKKKNPSCQVMPRQDFIEDLREILDQPISMALSAPDDAPQKTGHEHHHGAGHSHHNPGIHSASISSRLLIAGKPLDHSQLNLFLDLLLSAHGEHVLRLKGLVNINGESGPVLVQTAGKQMSPIKTLNAWPDEDHRTRLVVFLDGMDGWFVERLFNGFIDLPSTDTPDKVALTQNPLAIAGFTPKP